MLLPYTVAGGEFCRGVCIGEHWEQKNFGEEQQFFYIKDYFFFSVMVPE